MLYEMSVCLTREIFGAACDGGYPMVFPCANGAFCIVGAMISYGDTLEFNPMFA